MGLTNLFEEIKRNLKRHDGTPEGRLNYYETQLLKGKSLDKDQRREYLEDKGIGVIDPDTLTFEEVVKPLPMRREDNEGYSPNGHSLLYLWTTQKYLRHLPNNLEKIPKRFFTKEALLTIQLDTKETVLYNLYRYKIEHLVPEEMKTEEFLTSNRWGKNKPLHVVTTMLGELIEVAGIRAIPEHLRTEEFLMKNRGGNYFTLVATQGDLLKMPQSTITLENLTKNKTVNNESLLHICGKYGQLNDLPQDFYSKDNLKKYKKEFIEALCATCSSTNPSASAKSIPDELLKREFVETPQGDNLPNAIQAAAVAHKIDIIPPKIFADNLFYTNDWSTYCSSRGSKGNPLDLLTENGTRPLNPAVIPHFKKVLEHVDRDTLKKIGGSYQMLLPLIKEEQKNRVRKSINQMSENSLSIA